MKIIPATDASKTLYQSLTKKRSPSVNVIPATDASKALYQKLKGTTTPTPIPLTDAQKDSLTKAKIKAFAEKPYTYPIPIMPNIKAPADFKFVPFGVEPMVKPTTPQPQTSETTQPVNKNIIQKVVSEQLSVPSELELQKKKQEAWLKAPGTNVQVPPELEPQKRRLDEIDAKMALEFDHRKKIGGGRWTMLGGMANLRARHSSDKNLAALQKERDKILKENPEIFMEPIVLTPIAPMTPETQKNLQTTYDKNEARITELSTFLKPANDAILKEGKKPPDMSLVDYLKYENAQKKPSKIISTIKDIFPILGIKGAVEKPFYQATEALAQIEGWQEEKDKLSADNNRIKSQLDQKKYFGFKPFSDETKTQIKRLANLQTADFYTHFYPNYHNEINRQMAEEIRTRTKDEEKNLRFGQIPTAAQVGYVSAVIPVNLIARVWGKDEAEAVNAYTNMVAGATPLSKLEYQGGAMAGMLTNLMLLRTIPLKTITPAVTKLLSQQVLSSGQRINPLLQQAIIGGTTDAVTFGLQNGMYELNNQIGNNQLNLGKLTLKTLEGMGFGTFLGAGGTLIADKLSSLAVEKVGLKEFAAKIEPKTKLYNVNLLGKTFVTDNPLMVHDIINAVNAGVVTSGIFTTWDLLTTGKVNPFSSLMGLGFGILGSIQSKPYRKVMTDELIGYIGNRYNQVQDEFLQRAQIHHALDILGLPPEATAEEIKTKYGKLGRQYHPDMAKTPELKPEFQKKFNEVNNAFNFLMEWKAPLTPAEQEAKMATSLKEAEKRTGYKSPQTRIDELQKELVSKPDDKVLLSQLAGAQEELKADQIRTKEQKQPARKIFDKYDTGIIADFHKEFKPRMDGVTDILKTIGERGGNITTKYKNKNYVKEYTHWYELKVSADGQTTKNLVTDLDLLKNLEQSPKEIKGGVITSDQFNRAYNLLPKRIEIDNLFNKISTAGKIPLQPAEVRGTEIWTKATDLLKDKNEINNTDLAVALNITPVAAGDLLSKLEDAGLVGKWEGEGKPRKVIKPEAIYGKVGVGGNIEITTNPQEAQYIKNTKGDWILKGSVISEPVTEKIKVGIVNVSQDKIIGTLPPRQNLKGIDLPSVQVAYYDKANGQIITYQGNHADNNLIKILKNNNIDYDIFNQRVGNGEILGGFIDTDGNFSETTKPLNDIKEQLYKATGGIEEKKIIPKPETKPPETTEGFTEVDTQTLEFDRQLNKQWRDANVIVETPKGKISGVLQWFSTDRISIKSPDKTYVLPYKDQKVVQRLWIKPIVKEKKISAGKAGISTVEPTEIPPEALTGADKPNSQDIPINAPVELWNNKKTLNNRIFGRYVSSDNTSIKVNIKAKGKPEKNYVRFKYKDLSYIYPFESEKAYLGAQKITKEDIDMIGAMKVDTKGLSVNPMPTDKGIKGKDVNVPAGNFKVPTTIMAVPIQLFVPSDYYDGGMMVKAVTPELPNGLPSNIKRVVQNRLTGAQAFSRPFSINEILNNLHLDLLGYPGNEGDKGAPIVVRIKDSNTGKEINAAVSNKRMAILNYILTSNKPEIIKLKDQYLAYNKAHAEEWGLPKDIFDKHPDWIVVRQITKALTPGELIFAVRDWNTPKVETLTDPEIASGIADALKKDDLAGIDPTISSLLTALQKDKTGAIMNAFSKLIGTGAILQYFNADTKQLTGKGLRMIKLVLLDYGLGYKMAETIYDRMDKLEGGNKAVQEVIFDSAHQIAKLYSLDPEIRHKILVAYDEQSNCRTLGLTPEAYLSQENALRDPIFDPTDPKNEAVYLFKILTDKSNSRDVMKSKLNDFFSAYYDKLPKQTGAGLFEAPQKGEGEIGVPKDKQPLEGGNVIIEKIKGKGFIPFVDLPKDLQNILVSGDIETLETPDNEVVNVPADRQMVKVADVNKVLTLFNDGKPKNEINDAVGKIERHEVTEEKRKTMPKKSKIEPSTGAKIPEEIETDINELTPSDVGRNEYPEHKMAMDFEGVNNERWQDVKDRNLTTDQIQAEVLDDWVKKEDGKLIDYGWSKGDPVIDEDNVFWAVFTMPEKPPPKELSVKLEGGGEGGALFGKELKVIYKSEAQKLLDQEITEKTFSDMLKADKINMLDFKDVVDKPIGVYFENRRDIYQIWRYDQMVKYEDLLKDLKNLFNGVPKGKGEEKTAARKLIQAEIDKVQKLKDAFKTISDDWYLGNEMDFMYKSAQYANSISDLNMDLGKNYEEMDETAQNFNQELGSIIQDDRAMEAYYDMPMKDLIKAIADDMAKEITPKKPKIEKEISNKEMPEKTINDLKDLIDNNTPDNFIQKSKDIENIDTYFPTDDDKIVYYNSIKPIPIDILTERYPKAYEKYFEDNRLLAEAINNERLTYPIEEIDKFAKLLPETIGIRTAERLRLREKIKNDMIGKGSKTKDRKIVIVFGIVGSGKTTQFVNPLRDEGYVVIDSDIAKRSLPEYFYGIGASSTNEESNLISNSALKECINNGDNIVLAIVGKNLEKVKGFIDNFTIYNKNPYEVTINCMVLDIEKAVRRSIQRWHEGGNYCSEEYIRGVGLTPEQNYDILKSYKGVSVYEKYDNNVPKGTKPKKIESGTNPAPSGGIHAESEIAGVRPGAGTLGRTIGETETTAEVKPQKLEGEYPIGTKVSVKWNLGKKGIKEWPGEIVGYRSPTNPDEDFLRVDVKFENGRLMEGLHPDNIKPISNIKVKGFSKTEITRFENELPGIKKDIAEGRDIAATIHGYGYTFMDDIKRFHDYLIATNNPIAEQMEKEWPDLKAKETAPSLFAEEKPVTEDIYQNMLADLTPEQQTEIKGRYKTAQEFNKVSALVNVLNLDKAIFESALNYKVKPDADNLQKLVRQVPYEHLRGETSNYQTLKDATMFVKGKIITDQTLPDQAAQMVNDILTEKETPEEKESKEITQTKSRLFNDMPFNEAGITVYNKGKTYFTQSLHPDQPAEAEKTNAASLVELYNKIAVEVPNLIGLTVDGDKLSAIIDEKLEKGSKIWFSSVKALKKYGIPLENIIRAKMPTANLKELEPKALAVERKAVRDKMINEHWLDQHPAASDQNAKLMKRILDGELVASEKDTAKIWDLLGKGIVKLIVEKEQSDKIENNPAITLKADINLARKYPAEMTFVSDLTPENLAMEISKKDTPTAKEYYNNLAKAIMNYEYDGTDDWHNVVNKVLDEVYADANPQSLNKIMVDNGLDTKADEIENKVDPALTDGVFDLFRDMSEDSIKATADAMQLDGNIRTEYEDLVRKIKAGHKTNMAELIPYVRMLWNLTNFEGTQMPVAMLNLMKDQNIEIDIVLPNGDLARGIPSGITDKEYIIAGHKIEIDKTMYPIAFNQVLSAMDIDEYVKDLVPADRKLIDDEGWQVVGHIEKAAENFIPYLDKLEKNWQTRAKDPTIKVSALKLDDGSHLIIVNKALFEKWGSKPGDQIMLLHSGVPIMMAMRTIKDALKKIGWNKWISSANDEAMVALANEKNITRTIALWRLNQYSLKIKRAGLSKLNDLLKAADVRDDFVKYQKDQHRIRELVMKKTRSPAEEIEFNGIVDRMKSRMTFVTKMFETEFDKNEYAKLTPVEKAIADWWISLRTDVATALANNQALAMGFRQDAQTKLWTREWLNKQGELIEQTMSDTGLQNSLRLVKDYWSHVQAGQYTFRMRHKTNPNRDLLSVGWDVDRIGAYQKALFLWEMLGDKVDKNGNIIGKIKDDFHRPEFSDVVYIPQPSAADESMINQRIIKNTMMAGEHGQVTEQALTKAKRNMNAETDHIIEMMNAERVKAFRQLEETPDFQKRMKDYEDKVRAELKEKHPALTDQEIEMQVMKLAKLNADKRQKSAEKRLLPYWAALRRRHLKKMNILTMMDFLNTIFNYPREAEARILRAMAHREMISLKGISNIDDQQWIDEVEQMALYERSFRDTSTARHHPSLMKAISFGNMLTTATWLTFRGTFQLFNFLQHFTGLIPTAGIPNYLRGLGKLLSGKGKADLEKFLQENPASRAVFFIAEGQDLQEFDKETLKILRRQIPVWQKLIEGGFKVSGKIIGLAEQFNQFGAAATFSADMLKQLNKIETEQGIKLTDQDKFNISMLWGCYGLAMTQFFPTDIFNEPRLYWKRHPLKQMLLQLKRFLIFNTRLTVRFMSDPKMFDAERFGRAYVEMIKQMPDLLKNPDMKMIVDGVNINEINDKDMLNNAEAMINDVFKNYGKQKGKYAWWRLRYLGLLTTFIQLLTGLSPWITLLETLPGHKHDLIDDYDYIKDRFGEGWAKQIMLGTVGRLLNTNVSWGVLPMFPLLRPDLPLPLAISTAIGDALKYQAYPFAGGIFKFTENWARNGLLNAIMTSGWSGRTAPLMFGNTILSADEKLRHEFHGSKIEKIARGFFGMYPWQWEYEDRLNKVAADQPVEEQALAKNYRALAYEYVKLDYEASLNPKSQDLKDKLAKKGKKLEDYNKKIQDYFKKLAVNQQRVLNISTKDKDFKKQHTAYAINSDIIQDYNSFMDNIRVSIYNEILAREIPDAIRRLSSNMVLGGEHPRLPYAFQRFPEATKKEVLFERAAQKIATTKAIRETIPPVKFLENVRKRNPKYMEVVPELIPYYKSLQGR